MNPKQVRKYRQNLSDECLGRTEELISDNGGRNFILDTHQAEGMLEAAVALNDGKDRFSIVHPGGSGKTVLEAGIIQASQVAKRDLSGPFQQTKDIVLTVERSLMETVRSHIAELIGEDVGVWGLGKRELEPNVIVASVQALQKNRAQLAKMLDPHNVSLVIGDEADKFLTTRRKTLLNRFKNAIRIGFTATPQWPDGRHINDAWGEIVHEMTLIEGIRRGVNVPASYFLLEADIDGDEIKVANGDYDSASLAAAMKSVEVEESVVQVYKTLMVPERRLKRFPTLVYVPSVHTLHATTRKLREALADEDVVISSWHGDIKHSQLSEEIADFRAGSIDILVLCEMGGRGLDLPRARCIIDAYPTLSDNKLEQRHSRSLRKIREGTKAHREGVKKPYALIAQIVPRSNSFRPVTLLDILKCWPKEGEDYTPGEIIGRSKDDMPIPDEPGAPVQDEIEAMARDIRAISPRCNVRLIERADLYREIKLRSEYLEGIPQADEEGFYYEADEEGVFDRNGIQYGTVDFWSGTLEIPAKRLRDQLEEVKADCRKGVDTDGKLRDFYPEPIARRAFAVAKGKKTGKKAK